jgi:hypothetical protein
MPRKKSKSSKRATQSQVVKVNVKNIIQQIKERQGDMIQVKRKRPMDNFNTGGQSRLVAPPMSYGNPMPIFLPVQERTIYVAPEEKAIGNSVIPSRPNLMAEETNPADIVPSRPSVVAFRPSNPLPLTPAGQRYMESLAPVSPDMAMIRARFAEINRPQATPATPPRIMIPSLLDESENLVARAMDQDSRDFFAMDRERRSASAKKGWASRREREAAVPGVPRAPSSGFPSAPSREFPSAAAASASAVPRRQVIEED